MSTLPAPGDAYGYRLVWWGRALCLLLALVLLGHAVYQLAATRHVVCVQQRPGALAIRWYLVAGCPEL